MNRSALMRAVGAFLLTTTIATLTATAITTTTLDVSAGLTAYDVTASHAVTTSTINESTTNAGVTIDSVWLKDAIGYVTKIKAADSLTSGAEVDFTGGANTLTLTATNGVTTSKIKPGTIADSAGNAWMSMGAGIGTIASGASLATNTIAETTAASGVTVDGALIKDGIPRALVGGSTGTSGPVLSSYATSLNASPSSTGALYQAASYTVPASAMNAATTTMRITAWGIGAANTNNRSVRVYLPDTTAIGLCTFTSASDTLWWAEWRVYRTGSNAVSAIAKCQSGSGATISSGSGTWTETAANALSVGLTAATATSDITIKGVSFEVLQ